jgi:hypothetical protein
MVVGLFILTRIAAMLLALGDIARVPGDEYGIARGLADRNQLSGPGHCALWRSS